jgi:hypothetical protein
MRPVRATRLAAAVIAVFSLLFTQLALASYVCPGSVTMADMSHCAGMDKAQPGLCHASGHAAHQSLDKPDLPQIPPFHAVGPVLTIIVPDLAAHTPPALPAAPLLARAAAPPLAIRHCCFRI